MGINVIPGVEEEVDEDPLGIETEAKRGDPIRIIPPPPKVRLTKIQTPLTLLNKGLVPHFPRTFPWAMRLSHTHQCEETEAIPTSQTLKAS